MGGAILTPNELVFTFGGLHVCVHFGENRRRNATLRLSTDGHTHTHAQTQNDFIICPMLYAIAVGQIKSGTFYGPRCTAVASRCRVFEDALTVQDITLGRAWRRAQRGAIVY